MKPIDKKILGVKVKVNDCISIRSKYVPSNVVDFGIVVGFTETNINLENDPTNPLCDKDSIPIDWITEVKKHKDIKEAIDYSNQEYSKKA